MSFARTRCSALPAVGVILCLPACGSAPVDVHAAYARIQVAEARIAHAGAEGRTETAADTAEDRAARCAEICDASAAIAAEAQLLDGDADAATRAERARAACDACGSRTP